MTGLYSFHCEPIIAVMLISLFNYSAGSHGRAVIKRKICQSERCHSLPARYGHVGTKRYWAHLKGPGRGSKEHPLHTWKTFHNASTDLISWLTTKSKQRNVNTRSQALYPHLGRSSATTSAAMCQRKSWSVRMLWRRRVEIPTMLERIRSKQWVLKNPYLQQSGNLTLIFEGVI